MKTNVYSMTKSRIISIILLGTLLTLAACTSSQPEPTAVPEVEAQPEATGTIVLGDVSDDPVDKIEEFLPLADYLAANLAEQGIGVGEVKIAPNLATMSDWLASGEVDFYFDSAYSTVIVGETASAYPILRRWKDGVAEYNTVIAVRVESDINTLEDLQGHIVGFEEAGSNSGFFMPIVHLLDNGMTVAEKETPTADVAADEIGYVFTGDDEFTVEWLFTGEIDAGAIPFDDFEGLPEDIKSELRVLEETEMIPRHLVIVRPDMEPELEAAVKALMLAMDETAEGPEVLEQFEETAQFDEIPAAGAGYLDRAGTFYEQFQVDLSSLD